MLGTFPAFIIFKVTHRSRLTPQGSLDRQNFKLRFTQIHPAPVSTVCIRAQLSTEGALSAHTLSGERWGLQQGFSVTKTGNYRGLKNHSSYSVNAWKSGIYRNWTILSQSKQSNGTRSSSLLSRDLIHITPLQPKGNTPLYTSPINQ